MKFNLSPRQGEVYAAIVAHWAEHAMSPTLVELMAATGIEWVSAMRNHVTALRSKGWLTPATASHAARDMVPTDLAESIKQSARNLTIEHPRKAVAA